MTDLPETERHRPAEPGLAADPHPLAEPCALELRYRRLLRVLPRAYRRAREQEMVDTFLDNEFGADPENADLTAKFGGVGWRESASVLALALRLRWADPHAPARFRVRAEALRTATLACLAVLAIIAAQGVVSWVWYAIDPPDDVAASSALDLLIGRIADVWGAGAWSTLTTFSFLLWIPSLVLATGRSSRAAIGAALLAAVPAVVLIAEIAMWPGFAQIDAFTLWSALVQLAVVAGLGVLAVAATREPPGLPATHRPRRYLTAAATAFTLSAAVGVIVALSVTPASPAWVFAVVAIVSDISGLWCLATVVAAATTVARRRTLVTADLLALSVFALVATILRGTTIAPWLSQAGTDWPGSRPIAVSATAQLVVVAAITVTAGILATRRIRRLPMVRYAVDGPPGPAATA